MKATGIVRRIDDLGRVVIPKEIRRTLRIREGDPLELFLEKDTVCFKKYSVLGNIEDEANRIIKTYKDGKLIITDMDYIIASHTTRYVSKSIPSEYIDTMQDRRAQEVQIEFPDTDISIAYVIPIISEGEVIGSVSAVKPLQINQIRVRFVVFFLVEQR